MDSGGKTDKIFKVQDDKNKQDQDDENFLVMNMLKWLQIH